MTAHPFELAGIVAALQKARHRNRLRLIVEAVASAAAAGLLTVAVLGGGRVLFPDLWVGWFGDADAFPLSAVGIALGVVALVLVVLLPIALMRTPRLLSLARSADHAFGLQERISTALEIMPSAGAERPNAVFAALSRDAASHAGAIDPKSLAPFRIPRVAWTLPPLLLCAAYLWFMPLSLPLDVPEAGGTTVAVAEGPNALTADERKDAAKAIQQISSLIARGAEERSDPFVYAAAQTLDMLERQVSSDLTLDRGEVLSELEQVSDFMQKAGEEWSGESGSQLAALLQDASRQIGADALPIGQTDAKSTGQSSKTLNQRVEGQPNASTNPKMNPNATQVPEQGRQGTKDGLVQDKLTKLSSSDGGQESGASGGEGQATTASANHYSVVRRDEQGQTQRADAIGNFEQSPDGNLTDPMANPWGGETSQATDSPEGAGDGAAMPDVEFETDTELMLEAKSAGTGRRIRKDMPPTAQFSKVEDRASPEGNAAWSMLEEKEVSRPYLGPDLRDVVSTYFMSRNKQVGE